MGLGQTLTPRGNLQPELEQRANPPAWREGIAVVGAVLVSRLLLLAVLGKLVHGREFTDDAPMLLGLARHPFELLSGVTATYGQHPPFLGVLEAVVSLPARAVMSDFYAIRFTLLVWEAVAAGFAWLALSALLPDDRVRRLALAGVVLLPAGWVTSTVMAQDEVIAAAWVAAVVWLTARRRYDAALVVCGLGVVAAKIFLAVPLLVLIALLEHRTFLRRAALGLAPVVVAYGWVVAVTIARGNDVPLLGFDPAAKFGVNAWVLFDVDAATSRRISEVFVALLVIALIAVCRSRHRSPTALMLTATIAAGLLWSYLAFYHVNPEYYALLLVPVVALVRRPGEWVLAAVLFSAPWLVNLFYGVDNPTHNLGEKGRITKLVDRITPGDLHTWFVVSVWLCIASTTVAAVWATRKAVLGSAADDAAWRSPNTTS